MPLRQVTVDDLAGWKATWNAQTDIGKQREQQRLRTFFRWCRSRKYIEDDPTDGLIAVKVSSGGRRERFTDVQVARIFEVVGGLPEPFTSTVRAFLLVLRYTALRIGDVTNLQKCHLTGDKLFLYAMKNGQAVYTVVPDSVVAALKAIETENGYYFYPGHDGTLETWKKKWSVLLQPIYQKAKVSYRSHAWRDTLVYKLLRAGITIEIVVTAAEATATSR